MYFVPHFGHAQVYETSIWTPCFQILAKTMEQGGGGGGGGGGVCGRGEQLDSTSDRSHKINT